ncbi:ABC transporter substrate-binding protein [Halioxenophilus sp. WMMB6]|uniref:ABC transporter substrate-binding protein n=1 Tax=Halioxenophilus sp. WMMB6 TaxID=3073815 RepID=UPI00295E4067|nr:ABC transporter substrate-binding protein [Halioxenophilus sp. WMMB6]
MNNSIKVGLLNDLASTPPSPSDLESWLQRVADDYWAAGRLPAPVQFINGWGLGLPEGSAANVLAAYQQLVAEPVVMVVGPAIGDNALAVTPLVTELQVPTINWAGSERARSEWMFQLQIGSHEDESILLARFLEQQQARSVAVVYDQSPIGDGYRHFFLAEANRLGCSPRLQLGVPPVAEALAEDAFVALASTPVDAVVYLGLGHVLPTLALALAGAQFSGLTLATSAGIRGYQPGVGAALEGWIYADLVSEHNSTLVAYRQRLNLPARQSLAAAKGYDMGRLVMEGLARAPALTPAGVRQGLELIKWLPASLGEEGTLLGFGQWQRGALQGRYLVLRQWLAGDSCLLKYSSGN